MSRSESVTAHTETDHDDPSSPPDVDSLSALRWCAVAAGGGVLLAAVATPIVDLLDRVLPLSATVASRGTNLGPFTDVAPTILRRTGALITFAAIVTAATVRWPTLHRNWPESAGRTVAGLVVVATTLWYGWLGRPHDGFPSNARYHWVDYLTWDSDNYFYAAGRLPHWIFYDTPYLWNGLNAGLVALLCYVIGRQLGLSTWRSAGMSTIPALAGNLLLFTTTAEDVMLNVLLLLMVISAALTRHPALLGAALALAILGRPTFIILGACVLVAEAVSESRRHGIRDAWRQLEWRFLTLTATTAIGLTILAQAAFTIAGNRYFLTGGRVIDTGPIANNTPQDVNGFTISPFSGAFVGHLWMFPLTALIVMVIAIVVAPHLSRNVESTVYLAGSFVVLHLALHESQAQLYYNVRYLTYLVPFVFVAGWALATHPRFDRVRPLSTAAIVVLLLQPMVIPSTPIANKRQVEARTEHELLAIRDELRELAGDNVVHLDVGNHGTRNYLHYVLRRDMRGIAQTAGDARNTGGLVISDRNDPWSTQPPALSTPTYLIFVVPTP